jgi:hypothetical protein
LRSRAAGPQAKFLAGELRDACLLYNAAKQERDGA